MGADSQAAKAGFRPYDLLQELGGKPVATAADAQAIVANPNPKAEPETPHDRTTTTFFWGRL